MLSLPTQMLVLGLLAVAVRFGDAGGRGCRGRWSDGPGWKWQRGRLFSCSARSRARLGGMCPAGTTSVSGKPRKGCPHMLSLGLTVDERLDIFLRLVVVLVDGMSAGVG